MKVYKSYLFIFIIILFLLILVTLVYVFSSKTIAKYSYSIDINNSINVGYISFNLVADENNSNVIIENENLNLTYKLRNYNGDLINGANLNFYIKVLDMNDNEISDSNVIIENYNYHAGEINAYGIINLASDSITKDEKEIVLNMLFDGLNNNDFIRFKIRVIAENDFTKNIEKYEDYVFDLIYKNEEDDSSNVNIYSDS